MGLVEICLELKGIFGISIGILVNFKAKIEEKIEKMVRYFGGAFWVEEW